jgi:mono/diheme cytochrome c family protein
VLATLDRILAPLSWLAAAALVVMLLAGPALVADDSGKPAAKASAGVSPYAKPAKQTASAVDAKQLFTDNCGSCHTLSKAGTSGATGPKLDSIGLDANAVAAVMKAGPSIMPAFGDTLKPDEIAAVAAYVAG